MFTINSKKLSAPGQSITRWFLVCFTCFSIIFSIALIPLVSYCRNVFTELEIKKSTQQMDFGISHLENTVTSIASASQSLTNATQFISFRHLEPDYSSISISVRNQLKNYLNSLVFPLTLVSDSTLLFSADCAVTPTATVFHDNLGYYPSRFSVDNLSYEQWMALLEENGSGFLEAHQITTPRKTYHALIYSIPWTKDSYLYSCLDISDVKRALIAEQDLARYYLTISDSQGKCLYSDLDDTLSDYHSVTQKTSVGNLVVTIHIPNAALTARMGPLYFFLGLYLSICILVLLITCFAGSHFSSRPLLKLLSVLESHDTQQPAAPDATSAKKRTPSLHYGFHYMQERVNLFERDLNEYRNTIYTQKRVLQSRYMEKALHGSLNSTKDKEAFHSYFPNFPPNYCLVQFGLTEEGTSDNATLYPDSLYLVQAFIQNELPHAYQLQMSDSELLLIIAEEDFEQYHDILNHLIDNINREEPSYLAWGVASRFYHHLESLPTAYWQLQDMNSMISHDSPSQLYTTSDYLNTSRQNFQIRLHRKKAYGLCQYTSFQYRNEHSTNCPGMWFCQCQFLL